MRCIGKLALFGLAMLLSGLSHAQQQEPVFRGIQPKETIIDAWKREETRPAKSPVTHGSKAQKREQAGVPLSFLIIFEYNSAELTETAKKQLDGVAEAIKSSEFSGSRFAVEGHTDIIGSEPFNLDLSKRRAEAVRDYLVRQQGISASKLSAVGVGERDLYNPADPTAEENRRVRIIRYAG
jgi:outer membrane protein OmpA-like peptidoglycan-associated protein